MRKVVWGLVGLSVLGCATPQRRAEQADWRTVCANAPYGEGQSITASEQRAMTRLDLWKVSVEELNRQCDAIR